MYPDRTGDAGNGSVNAIGESNYDMAVYTNGSGAVVNISGGSYSNSGQGCDLIYIGKKGGKVNISDGVFIATQKGTEDGTDNEYSALNCQDDAYKARNAIFSVTGGKFYKFNPANNVSEGANTNFVAEGYSSYKDGDYYKVSATSEGTTVTEALSVVNW